MMKSPSPLPSTSEDSENCGQIEHANWPRVCVAIPVLNGGNRFAEVCGMLSQQDYPGEMEVLCIDSGSHDNSRDVVQEHGFRLHQIEPQTYGHGRTRNLAFELSTAPLVAFLTHDAVPDRPDWLRELICALRQGDDIAGAYSRHIAHHGANPFLRRDLDLHFSCRIPIVRKADYPDFDQSEQTRQLCHFFSDNAAVLRRDVWEMVPYPDVDFAEDQLWALQILNAGLAIAYAPESIVRHSHDFGPWETLRRSYDESRAFSRYFGYRLNRGPIGVLRSAAGAVAGDLRDGLRHGWVLSFPGATLSRLACDLARPLGHWIGTGKRARRGAPSFLSRDNSLR